MAAFPVPMAVPLPAPLPVRVQGPEPVPAPAAVTMPEVNSEAVSPEAPKLGVTAAPLPVPLPVPGPVSMPMTAPTVTQSPTSTPTPTSTVTFGATTTIPSAAGAGAGPGVAPGVAPGVGGLTVGPCLLGPPVAPEEAEAEEEDLAPLGSTSSGRKRLFSKELRCMMYGFGDDQNPYTESVDLLEDLVIEFITDMTHKGMEIGRTGRVQVEDIVFLVRKDQRKYARVKDLLTMNEELKKARKAFDEVKYVDPELTM